MQPQSGLGALEQWIADRIRKDGPVTFARFMSWALYHPRYGYYTRGPNIGPRGDFVTSPEASPAFGRLLARHLRDVDDLLGNPAPFDMIECGPGRGTLALDLLETVREESPSLYGRLRYWLVEISPALTRSQKSMLLPNHQEVVQWCAGLNGLPPATQGAVIANELIDAFPVHVLEKRDGILLEQGVGVNKEGALTTVYFAPSEPRLVQFLRDEGIELAPGERIEVNLAAGKWLRDLSSCFHRGVVTIIDYGDLSPERYSQARRQGTLLGYYSGSVTDNLLARPGEQDLTSLVDFTALEHDAQRAGFDYVAITRQANFLLGLGLGTAITPESVARSYEEALQYRRGLQSLVSMEGLGRFHVLILAKGVDLRIAANLSALKYIDY